MSSLLSGWDGLPEEIQPQLGPGGSGAPWPAGTVLQRLPLVWLGLAGYWLLRAFTLRWNPEHPQLPELFDQFSLSLWISGLALGWGADTALQRKDSYVRLAPLDWLAPSLGVGRDLWLALLQGGFWLALACLPALLAYQPKAVLMLATTNDPIEFNLRLLPAALFNLLFFGSLAAVCSATLSFALRRWLGANAGAALWLAALLAVHWQALSNWDLMTITRGGGFTWIDRVPLSLGQQLIEFFTNLRAPNVSPYYSSEILMRFVLLMLGLCGVSLLLMLLGCWRWQPRGQIARMPLLLVTAACLPPLGNLVPGLYHWLDSAAVRGPGDWRAMLLLGLQAAWLAVWLTLWPAGIPALRLPSRLVTGGSTVLLAAYWLLLSWPAILAGQLTQRDAALQSALALLLLAAGCALLVAAELFSRGWPWWLSLTLRLLSLGLLILPLSQESGSLPAALLDTLPAALLEPAQRLPALIICACLLALIFLLPLQAAAVARRRRTANAGATLPRASSSSV